MADDLKQTGKMDDTRINIDRDYELSYWSEKFGISCDELRSAVGPIVTNVRDHLQHRS